MAVSEVQRVARAVLRAATAETEEGHVVVTGLAMALAAMLAQSASSEALARAQAMLVDMHEAMRGGGGRLQ
jgi:hypothetical protein